MREIDRRGDLLFEDTSFDWRFGIGMEIGFHSHGYLWLWDSKCHIVNISLFLCVFQKEEFERGINLAVLKACSRKFQFLLKKSLVHI